MGISLFNIVIAFVGGLLSFLSPCVLPLVPGYISLMSGVSVDHLKEGAAKSRRAVIANSLAFNAGLSVIFLTLGATAGYIGSAVFGNLWVRIVSGLVIIVFGLHLIGLLKIKYLYKDTRHFKSDEPRGIWGSLTLGIAFAAGWTPCIGPILGGIIGLAATTGGWKGGLILSAFYSAGLAVPFLVTGLGINQFLGFYGKFRRHLHKVEVVSGVVLILIGVLILSNRVTILNSQQLAAWLPDWESRLKLKGSNQAPLTTAQNFPIAPDVQFTKLDGSALRLNELRGQVVLLNFWATWCIPCRSEMPEFNAIQRDLGNRGLAVIGASVSPLDTPDVIRSFQRDVKQDYTIVRGAEEIGTQFRNGPGLPVTHVLDRDGRIRQTFFGPQSRETFESIIKPLLDEARTTAKLNN
jgi:cytochrome c-type biogenesis protein